MPKELRVTFLLEIAPENAGVFVSLADPDILNDSRGSITASTAYQTVMLYCAERLQARSAKCGCAKCTENVLAIGKLFNYFGSLQAAPNG